MEKTFVLESKRPIKFSLKVSEPIWMGYLIVSSISVSIWVQSNYGDLVATIAMEWIIVQYGVTSILPTTDFVPIFAAPF